MAKTVGGSNNPSFSDTKIRLFFFLFIPWFFPSFTCHKFIALQSIPGHCSNSRIHKKGAALFKQTTCDDRYLPNKKKETSDCTRIKLECKLTYLVDQTHSPPMYSMFKSQLNWPLIAKPLCTCLLPNKSWPSSPLEIAFNHNHDCRRIFWKSNFLSA